MVILVYSSCASNGRASNYNKHYFHAILKSLKNQIRNMFLVCIVSRVEQEDQLFQILRCYIMLLLTMETTTRP